MILNSKFLCFLRKDRSLDCHFHLNLYKIPSQPLYPDEKAVCDRYEKAGDLIKNFVTNLEDDYKIWSLCCPGNHDITHE